MSGGDPGTGDGPVATLWCVVPAAGTGSRMGADVPKQYLPLAGRPLLAWTLDALLAVDPAGLVLVLAPGDDRGLTAPWIDARVERLPRGGASRAETVLAGLDHLQGRAAPDDLVLVHDAARPCIAPVLVRRLVAAVAGEADGGLLAVPVADTVKAAVADDGASVPARIATTLDRRHLWLAQTPQVFPFRRLHDALRGAVSAGRTVTDEAAAIEAVGGRPLLVPGTTANLKVTRPEDLPLAEFWIARQQEQEA
ncbi:MAG TPA: 2-C-methyl-D-erythritol 4-phosphate cytidylyltransferase [Pseudomonadales bacterium]|nr:2-C-methyl-D-erythritol 4-phosphate cytidylyltransferase [Pseudomonadales bacterium]